MTSRDALREIKKDYDEEHQRENCLLDTIEKDLVVLEKIKAIFKDCCIEHKLTDYGMDTKIDFGKEFDKMMVKSILEHCGFKIVGVEDE